MEATVTFTEEEVASLESMFEVLVDGEGVYMMLDMPHTRKLHAGLLRKFKDALKEATGIDRG
jgi:hypothetical protein